MAELDLTAEVIDLSIHRGDTKPWRYTVKDSAGAAVDITGYTFLLTVDPSDEPANSDNNLFQLTGTIIDGPAGIVEFGMSAVQADQTPSVYYYDVQMTDGAAKLHTIIKGKFTFKQDITK